MPTPEKYLADFEEGESFHVYNRTNNKERLFHSDENRRFFLQKYQSYLTPFLDTWCWCLMDTHFHMLVRVKSEKSIKQHLQGKELHDCTLIEKKFLTNEATLSELIEHAFKRFFQSYAVSFNKWHKRNGNLFYKPFKRVKITSDAQFTQTVIYIHANAVKHGIAKNFMQYEWSSWHSLISTAQTLLLRNELLEWFGGKEQFIKIHTENIVHCSVAEQVDDE
jgi:putative transposase